MTGVPHAIASTTGSPNPSRSDGSTTTDARRYSAASCGRSRNGSCTSASSDIQTLGETLLLARQRPADAHEPARRAACARNPPNTSSSTSMRLRGMVLETCSTSNLRASELPLDLGIGRRDRAPACTPDARPRYTTLVRDGSTRPVADQILPRGFADARDVRRARDPVEHVLGQQPRQDRTATPRRPGRPRTRRCRCT